MTVVDLVVGAIVVVVVVDVGKVFEEIDVLGVFVIIMPGKNKKKSKDVSMTDYLKTISTSKSVYLSMLLSVGKLAPIPTV